MARNCHSYIDLSPYTGKGIWINAALLLGTITGSMTSAAALQQVNGSAQSTLPALRYVGAYAFFNVLLAIIMRLYLGIVKAMYHGK